MSSLRIGRSWFVGAAVALGIAACDQSQHRTADQTTRAPGTDTAQAGGGEPSRSSDSGNASTQVPAATPDQGKGTETANANAPAMKSMTKEEESAAMPKPGQVNDHSTVTSDGSK